MRKLAFFDTKPYDKVWFDRFTQDYNVQIDYFEDKLSPNTALLADGHDAVVAFVNDDLGKDTIDVLHDKGIKLVAMRCAGYNNVDLKAASGKVDILRVPQYSPHAVAEHAIALILTLNRKIHRAYNRTRDFNFSLNGLTGFDLNGKTIGIVGTGKIGKTLIGICQGFGMDVLAFDPYPDSSVTVPYVSFDEITARSDIISLHCPLTKSTRYIINDKTIEGCKDGVLIINTSRGALIDTDALLTGLKSGKVGGAGLDVYEEEENLFFEDFSGQVIHDDVLAVLTSMPNVIITSHQAFLTDEALSAIARVTLDNIGGYFKGNVNTGNIVKEEKNG